MKLTSEKQLVLINLAFILLVTGNAFFPITVIRSILGLPALLFFPGYVLLLALFPAKNSLGNPERTALSFGASIAIVALIGMILSDTPFGVQLFTVLFSLWFFVLAIGGLALYRQRWVPSEQRYLIHLRWERRRAGFFSGVIAADRFKLFLILLLAYGLTFIPHLNYPYPLHVDEWMHLAYSRGIQEAGSTAVTAVPVYEFPDFSSGAITLKPGDVEPAFHVFWAEFQMVTGLSWLAVFRYFPGLIFLMTVLAIYAIARREGYGLEAAFLASLLPTNVTMLGPSLLVPVALGMMYLPLCLYLVLYQKTKTSYLLMAVIFSFLVLMHLPTAVILIIILVPFLAFAAARDWKHSATVLASAVVPLLAFSFPVVKVAPEFAGSFLHFTYLPAYLPYLPGPLSLWGYLPIIFFAAGVFLLSKKGGTQNYALILAGVLLLLHNISFSYWHRGVQIIYHRSPHFLMLLMSLLGGYALWRSRQLSWHSRFKVFSRHGLRYALVAIVIGLTLAEAVTYHTRAQFYHMIDEQDYASFVWIEQNLPGSYHKAILDPWKATAFIALARREVYTKIQHAPQEADSRAYDFLHDGCRDTGFLKENGISIVYSRESIDNDSLILLKDNIYVLPEK